MQKRDMYLIGKISLLIFLIFFSQILFAQTKIMPLGNSITLGKIDRANPPPGEHGYRDHLLNSLSGYSVSLTGPTSGFGSQFMNPDPPYLGYYVDGAKIDEFLPDSLLSISDMLDDLAVSDLPDLVLIHLGTNDLGSSYQHIGDYNTPGTITHELKMLVTYLLDYSRGGHEIEHIFLCKLIPDAPYTERAGANERIVELNTRIQELWENLEGGKQDSVTLVNMNAPFYANQLTYYNVDLDPATDDDHVHPNETGYEAMGQIFADYIKDYLAEDLVDHFDRPGIGPNQVLDGSNHWYAVDDSIRILNVGENGGGAIYCDAVAPWTWVNMAVWDSSRGMNSTEIKIHSGSTSNIDTLSGIGVLVGMDTTDLSIANGYMVFIINGVIRVFNVSNGAVFDQVDYYSIGTNYSPGAVFKVTHVVISGASNVNRFYVSLNGTEYPPLEHTYGFPYHARAVSGVIFRGGMGTAARIDYFKSGVQRKDVFPPGQIDNLWAISAGDNSITLTWTAVGNDGVDGQAASYDLRYSLSNITESNFEDAKIVPDVPPPKQSGQSESYTVRGLLPETRYYFAIKATDPWGNTSELSNVSWEITTGEPFSDTFNRTSIGDEWACDTLEYQIQNGELINTLLTRDWGSLAIYKRANPNTVRLVWGQSATNTGPPTGVENGGIVVLADDTTTTANGYLIFIRTTSDLIYLFSVVNGVITDLIDAVTYGLAYYPAAYDTLSVVMETSDPSKNKFDVYVNKALASPSSLYDMDKMYGNAADNYSGLILARIQGERNNNVEAFITYGEEGSVSQISAVGVQTLEGTVNQWLPDSVKVVVRDDNNIPKANIPITFALTQGGGEISAPQPPDNNIRIEAEWGNPWGTMIVLEGGEAGGGEYILSYSNNSKDGGASYPFYVETGGTYYFWGRTKSSFWSHYVLYFELEGKTNIGGFLWYPHYDIHGSSTWRWDPVRIQESSTPYSAVLSGGEVYTINIYNGHPNVPLDKLVITSDPNYIPFGKEDVDMLYTNDAGEVGTTWKLGQTSGTNQLVARTYSLEESVEFTAIGLADTAKTMQKVADNLSGEAGDTLDTRLTVVLYDKYGNRARPGIDVTFDIIAGEGQLTDPVAVTNGNGEASTNMVLGYQYTEIKIQATFDGYVGSNIIFTVNVIEGAVQDIESLTTTGVKHYVEDVLPNFLAVRVTDNHDEPIENTGVTFQVVSGDASVGVQPKITNNLGIAEDTLSLGPTPGIVKVIARCGTRMDTVVVDSIFYRGATMIRVGGDGQRISVNSTSSIPLEAIVFDGEGGMLYNYPVTFEITDLGYGFKFPNGSNKITVETKTTNGKASTLIEAGPVHGYYHKIVKATATNGFVDLDTLYYSLKVQSEANNLVKVTGDQGIGVVGEVLSEPLKVQLLSAIGNPVGGQPITFQEIKGNGYFEPSELPIKIVYTSQDSGYAMVFYRLGPETGLLNNEVVAYTKNMGTDSIHTKFQLSAKSSKADTMAAVDGTSLSGVVGKSLSAPIEVRLFDNLGNPATSDSVLFSIVSTTGGTLDTLNAPFKSADTTKTIMVDPETGKASVIWTLGKKAGSSNNELRVSASDGIQQLKGSPIKFYASAQADSVSPSESTIQATGPVYAATTDTSWITVMLYDQYDNPIVNQKVTLTVTGGTSNILYQPPNTDADGKAVGSLVSLTSGWKTIKAKAQGITLNDEAKVRFMSDGADDLNRVSGDDQIGNVGTILKNPFVVEVLDQYNNPVADAPVNFVVISGGGSIAEEDAISDSNGYAYAKLILGPDPGENLVEVNSSAIQSSVVFSATARDEEAVSLYFVSGSPQVKYAGEVIDQPFITGVEDKDHYPVANVDVFFEEMLGFGKLETASPVKTNAYGQAEAWFRVDTLANKTSRIEAKNSNLAGYASFFASSTSGPAMRMTKDPNSDNQEGYLGGTFPNPLTVHITDRYNNPVGGKLVKFQVLEGDAKVQGGISVQLSSNSYGMVSVPVTLGYTTGVIKIQASTTNPPLQGSPILFTLYANTADNTLTLSKYIGDNQKGTIGHRLALPLCVKVLDSNANPTPDRPVHFQGLGNGTVLDVQPVNTDELGLAYSNYQVGLSQGTEQVKAIISGNEVIFTVYAVSNTNIPVLNKDIIDPAYSVVEKADSPLRIPLVAEDPDVSSGDTLRFQHGSVSPPEGAEIVKQSELTAAMLWTPDWDQQGTYSLTLQVVDKYGGFDEKDALVNVINNDRPPQILSRNPTGDTTLTSGQTLPFWITTWDPDGDPLTYRWTVNGHDMSCDYAQFYYSIGKNDGGNKTVVASVSDGEAITTTTWVLNVTVSVELAEFYAQFIRDDFRVEVNWVTSSELDNVGFDVYRSYAIEGEYEKVNKKIIPSQHGGNYTYVDREIEVGRTYYYKLIDTDLHGNQKEHGPVMIEVPRPEKYVLFQNYPNPFNPITIIQYEVPRREHISLIVYNMMGQRVATLVDKVINPGYYTMEWKGENETGNEVSTGIYIYRLTSPSKVLTRKMIKMK